MTDAIRAAIESASAYLTEHPDEARYTDSIATATLVDGLHVRAAGVSGEAMHTDMPTAVGGGGAHPSPGWFLRAAVASCVVSLAAMRAAQLGLTAFRCEVDVDSESNDLGILGIDASVPGGPLSMRVAFRMAADGAADEQLRELAAWAVHHCPVSDAVRRAVPLTVDVAPG